MQKPASVPRPLAEQVLRRAVLMDEAEREALEAERQGDGFTLSQLRSAAAETGVDPGYVGRAAAALLLQRTERSQVAVLGYGVVTGVAAAVAAAGLLASGHPLLAAAFIVLDLILVATVLFGLDGHLRRGIAQLQELLAEAIDGGDRPRGSR